MNTCWAPHLEMIPKHFTMGTRTLFSASKQTHCTRVVSDSESKWVSVAFLHSTFWISTKVLTALFSCWHGWCHMELLLSQAHFVLTIITMMHQFTVSLIWSHMCRAHVCLAVTCLSPALFGRIIILLLYIIIIFIECFQLLVSQKNSVCVCVCVCMCACVWGIIYCLDLIYYFINAAYNLYVAVDWVFRF